METLPSYRRDLALLFIAIAIAFSIGLGAHAYLVPSEARYIELPRQMLATGDFLTPRINGVPYFEKPPLFYWMQAGMMWLFGNPSGDNEFTGRIVTLIFASAICLITYALGRMIFGRITGFFAAGALATSLMGYGLSHIAMLDVPVTFFITATIGAFLAAQITERKNFYYWMYGASALAVMTKGLIGIVIPGIVIGTWILLTRRWAILREAKLIPGLIIFLIIAAPWHILMARAHPDFLNFYFIHEHFSRFLTTEARRDKPWWFFTAVTLVGLLPWTGLLSKSIRQFSYAMPTPQFLLLWAVLPFIFFSTSHSQLLPYIFPIFPPLCIMIGNYLAERWDEDDDSGLRSLQLAAGLFLLVVTGGLIFFLALPYIPHDAQTKFLLPTHMPLGYMAPLILVWCGLIFAAFKCTVRPLIITLAISGLIIGITINYLAAEFDNGSIKPLAEMLKPQLGANDTVVSYNTYFQDLPIYLNRNVTVAGWQGELSFGIEHYPQTHAWMITDEDFAKLCAEKKPLYVFIKRVDMSGLPASCHLKEISNAGRNVLLKKE